jgi:iron complex transport system substrate-binding protein
MGCLCSYFMKKIVVVFLLIISFVSCRFANQSSTNGKDRIVCISKQLTELMFTLHQGNKIVGVDLSSTYPAEATKLTTVGYHRALSAEGIISLEPTLVIHQNDIAPDNVIPQLQGVGIPVKAYPQANTIDSTKILISLLGKEFGQDTAANRIIANMNEQLAQADAIVKKYSSKPRVMIVHFGRQKNQYFIMGTKGPAHKMIQLAGGVNVADSANFRNLSPEVILQYQPDVILATDFGYDRMGSKEKFAELPGLALTPAVKNGKIYRIEEHDLVYFGPRSGTTIINMAELIHK